MSLIALVWRKVVGRRAWAALLGTCVMALVVVASAPLLIESAAAEGALARTLSGGSVTVEQAGIASATDLETSERNLRRRVETELGPELRPVESSGAVTMLPVSINERRLAGDSRRLVVRSLDGLARHVDLLDGQFPAATSRQDEPVVTMWRDTADALGVRLSDLVCLDFDGATGRDPRWCARVVGLWEPVAKSDSYWGGTTPRMELVADRRDLLSLLRLGPPRGVVVGVRAAPDLTYLRTGDAGRVAQRLDRFRRSLEGQRQISFSSSLGQALASFSQDHQVAADGARRVTIGLTLLVSCLLLVVGSRFLDLEAQQTAQLAARGWRPGSLASLLLLQLALPSLPAIAVGLAVSEAAAASLGGWAGTSLWLAPDFDAPAALLALALVAVAGVFAFLVADAVGRDTEALAAERTEDPGVWWRRAGLDLLAAPPALALLAWPYFVGGLPAMGGLLDGVVGFWLRVLAIVLLSLAALRLLPIAADMIAGGRQDVAGRLASWELLRRRGQHEEVAFLLTLTMAIGLSAGAGAAGAALAPLPSAFRGILVASLLGGCLAGLVAGLVGFAAHFRAAALIRAAGHAHLVVQGLPPSGLRQSLAIEQATIVGFGLVTGTLLGLVLLTSLWAGGASSFNPASLVGAASVPLALAAGAPVAAWLARRSITFPNCRGLELQP